MYAEAQDAAGAVGRYRVRWGRPTRGCPTSRRSGPLLASYDEDPSGGALAGKSTRVSRPGRIPLSITIL
jgi:hypothetical protein